LPRKVSPPKDETADDRGVIGGMADQASEYWSQSQECMRDMVRDREATTVLMAAAAGLGVGLVIGAAMGRSHRQQLSWRDRVTAEGFGRRLMARLEQLVPDALAEHFGK
jgi:sugar (pentulose or hexulose) kinase